MLIHATGECEQCKSTRLPFTEQEALVSCLKCN